MPSSRTDLSDRMLKCSRNDLYRPVDNGSSDASLIGSNHLDGWPAWCSRVDTKIQGRIAPKGGRMLDTQF